ncbi:sulfur transferase domain-containing protein [Glycocaulis abyssi]|uniref:Tyrosine specific protein phosphatases domain-containing protein n=1 Tax=Glycocaulis abyssi TaxID=1433403 RepID=A0ABV9ND32_9PROT
MTANFDDPAILARARRSLMWDDHGVLRRAWHNHRHVGGQMWRGNQPDPERIAWLAGQGFRTILNLRGVQPGRAYYDLEHWAAKKHGLTVIDLGWGSREAPYVERIERLTEVFNTIKYPAFMHCKSGSDRAGIVAVMYLILHEGKPVEEAVSHLSLRYGHVKHGKTGMLDHFFQLYLDRNAQEPIDFLTWVRTEYDRQACHDGFMASWWGSILTERLLRRE